MSRPKRPILSDALVDPVVIVTRKAKPWRKAEKAVAAGLAEMRGQKSFFSPAMQTVIMLELAGFSAADFTELHAILSRSQA